MQTLGTTTCNNRVCHLVPEESFDAADDALRYANARIAALEAQVAEMQPIVDAVDVLSKNKNRCVICANREPGHWHVYTGRPEAHASTLADALIALAKEVAGE